MAMTWWLVSFLSFSFLDAILTTNTDPFILLADSLSVLFYPKSWV